MKRPLDAILNECIDQLEASGGDVEAVLARYPEHAEALRPYLSIWVSLSAMTNAEASREGALGGREVLLSAVAREKAEKERGRVPGYISKIGGVNMRKLVPIITPFLVGGAVAVGIIFMTGNLGSETGSTAQANTISQCVLQLDFNHDGKLDVQDVAAFKTAIQNQDLSFDFNGDGKVDVFDVEAAVQKVVACLQALQPTPPPLPTGTPAP